jgi:hypothetical protein
MLELRGGYDGLPPVVTRLLLWLIPKVAVMSRATLSVPFPTVKPPTPINTVTSILSASDPSLQFLGHAFLSPKYATFFDAETSKIFWDIRERTFYTEYCFHHTKGAAASFPLEEVEYFDMKRHKIEYHITNLLLRPSDPVNTPPPTNEMSRAILITLLLYIQMSHVDRASFAATYLSLILELQHLLLHSPIASSFWAPYEHAAIWILCFGAMGRSGWSSRNGLSASWLRGRTH